MERGVRYPIDASHLRTIDRNSSTSYEFPLVIMASLCDRAC